MIANVCACAQGCTPTFQAGAGELLDLPEAIRSRTPKLVDFRNGDVQEGEQRLRSLVQSQLKPVVQRQASRCIERSERPQPLGNSFSRSERSGRLLAAALQTLLDSFEEGIDILLCGRKRLFRAASASRVKALVRIVAIDVTWHIGATRDGVHLGIL